MKDSISVIVTASSGLEDCVYLPDLLDRADGRVLEVVVVDASPKFVDRSSPGLRHLSAPGRGIQGLIMEGIRHAKGEWVLVTEDHCRPLPGLVEEYREAIDRYPHVELFSGTAVNLTSVSPWSFANFMFGLGAFWPEAPAPSNASNANLLIRRSAILPSEQACEGGLLNLTIPRLIEAGRHRHCRNATVDHVVHLSWIAAVKFSFHCRGEATAVSRKTLPTRPTAMQLVRDFAVAWYLTAILPRQITGKFRGTPHASLAMTLRLMLLGLAHGAAILTVDINRLWAADRQRTT